jgi:hypothetical protein
MGLHHISWFLYIVGSLLVFGSWVDIVPTGLAWCGWLMALAGWGVGAVGQRRDAERTRQTITASKADEIAKLDLLRKQDIISEEEFQREKQHLLREP